MRAAYPGHSVVCIGPEAPLTPPIIEENVLKTRKILVVAAAIALCASPTFAQITPAAGYTPPDDTPKINTGVVIYTNYTYTSEPTTKDADGNVIHPNSFEVARAYINVTGNISHRLAFRVTPDISGRFATTVASTSTVTGGAPGEKVTTVTTGSTSYDGSLVFRLKYAFAQFNLDDWLPKGSWVRLGQQQTPYIDFIEGIYRYRFQGTTYVEREGFLSSSDVGISGHFALPNDYGDIHAGFYNGDTYSKAEANDQKAFQIRGTLRPLPHTSTLKGLRLTGFYDADKPIKSGARDRFVGSATFEHKHLNLGFDYLATKDQASGLPGTREIKAQGWSTWINPRATNGLEALFRYDDTKPDKESPTALVASAHRKRTIAGVSYWFPSQKKDSYALFADWEKVAYDTGLAKPTEQRYALHCLVAF